KQHPHHGWSLQASGLLLTLALATPAGAQETKVFSHADTLRGSITPQRAWWDVIFYDLHVAINPGDSSIKGYNTITYRVLLPGQEVQMDLQAPLETASRTQNGRRLEYRRDSNAFFVKLVAPKVRSAKTSITVYYQGKPRVARRPPWDGGLIWQRDSLGNRW